MMLHFRPKHIVVGLSGGVDSAVAAYLLQKQGHHIEAVFMKNWEENNPDDAACTSANDLKDAQAICELLKIDLITVNFAEEYWQDVFHLFLVEYNLGRTPNPDILCNKEIKFKAFLAFAKKRGADFIATGHYVRKREKTGELLKGRDPNKDQSYFLHLLDENKVKASLFPLGEYCKQEVRTLAKTLGFKNHNKKDSTGICFIGERRFKTFLQNYLPANTGEIRTLDEKVVGEHDGVMFYTIGQRQGLQIGGKSGYQELPWYVARKDVNKNILYVVQGDHPALYKTTLLVKNLHWINKPYPCLPFKTQAKTRYRQADQACILSINQAGCYQVDFNQPQRAITPGQAIVFYQDDICLGGGIIE